MATVSPGKRKLIALRDGLSFFLYGIDGFTHCYRCAVCRRIIPSCLATGGHITAAHKGGNNEMENLRLECWDCNQKDNQRFLQPPSNFSFWAVRKRIKKRIRKLSGKLRAWTQKDETKVFDNYPVWYDGQRISYTSLKRAKEFVQAGEAMFMEGAEGINLLSAPAKLSSDLWRPERFVPNHCFRCGAVQRLIGFWLYPKWHVYFATPKRASYYIRPVCQACHDIFYAVYAAEITRAALPLVQKWILVLQSDLHRRRIALKSYYTTQYGRVTPESGEEMRKEFGIDLRSDSLELLRSLAEKTKLKYTETLRLSREEIAQGVCDSGLYFPGLFEKICRNELSLETLEIPLLPVTQVEQSL